jgi:hypothetical protein
MDGTDTELTLHFSYSSLSTFTADNHEKCHQNLKLFITEL